mmetsp:Transcript_9636/g.23905  ORF Transcript_9636/g.23905 Transcript_9636/m.23905 type:complete len:166 (-) Transcript_9636:1093-1590(-)
MAGLLELLDKPAVQLVGSAAVVFGVQRLVPTFDPTWYKALRKPAWTPPNWAFPAVWIPLKLMQSYALSLIWREARAHPAGSVALALGAFTAHMALGNWWNIVFFGRRRLRESIPWMLAFWGSIAGTAAAFKPINQTAAALMLPTLAWVTVATKLNWDIVALNTPK